MGREREREGRRLVQSRCRSLFFSKNNTLASIPSGNTSLKESPVGRSFDRPPPLAVAALFMVVTVHKIFAKAGSNELGRCPARTNEHFVEKDW